MTNQHPIYPPEELVASMIQDAFGSLGEHGLADKQKVAVSFHVLATTAAQWGADQELEACCALLEVSDDNARDFLQSARRPKPLSLKKQALEALKDAGRKLLIEFSDQYGVIRLALEALPDD